MSHLQPFTFACLLFIAWCIGFCSCLFWGPRR